MMWGFGAWGMLWMLLFWGGLVLLVIWGIRQTSGGGTTQSSSRAREILEERFARGEIDAAEFSQRRDEIERR